MPKPTQDNPALFIAQKHTLLSYIRLVGRLYGEDEVFLQQYAEEQFIAWQHDLEKAIECFKGLLEQKKNLGKGKV